MPHILRKGRRLHYLDEGQGEPLLFLHGLGSRATDWYPQIAYLQQGYRIIAPDLCGHGESDAALANFAIADLAEDCLALLEQLQVTRCTVVGFSLGGMVAFELAARAPKKVQAMIIVNSAPSLGESSWKMQLAFLLRFTVLRLLGVAYLAKLIAKKIFPLPDQQALRHQFQQQMSTMTRVNYARALYAIKQWQGIENLAQFQMPMLIVAADQDYTPVSVKRHYQQQLVNAELLVIAESRHATPLDQSACFNREVERFIQKIYAGQVA